MQQIRGVYVALVTPIDESGQVDLDVLESFVDYLITEGRVHGLIPLGSTGEFYALNDIEKAAVTRAVIKTTAGRVPVLIGTNAGSTREVIKLSEDAQEAGAQGILLAPPYYSLPTPSELIAHFTAVDKSIDIPIMLYNYPARTGVDITPDLVEKLAELKNVAYIKESTGDATRVREIIRLCCGKIEVFCGSDSIAFESLSFGAIGWVAGVANVIPREHVELYELLVEKNAIDEARVLFRRILPILSCIEGAGKYTQWVKSACALSGHTVGPPRMPLLQATEAESARLRSLLEELKS